MCQRFRLTKQDDYFIVNLGHFLNPASVLRQLAGAMGKISLSRNLTTSCKFNQVTLDP